MAGKCRKLWARFLSRLQGLFRLDYSAVPENQLSDQVKTTLNQDTDKIIKQCLKEVEDLLVKEKELFERFAHELLVKEELEYDEIEAIFAEYGKVNPRRFGIKKDSSN